MSVRIETATVIDDVKIDQLTWTQLVEDNIPNTVFQTFEWFHSWWNIYGDRHELIFLTAYNNEEVIGFAPLMIATRKRGERVLRFVGDINADYCDFITQGNKLEIINAFLKCIYTKPISWNSILFQNIPQYSTTRAILETLSISNKYNIQVKNPIKTPALIIKNNHDESLRLANKYSVKRHLKKLNNIGVISFHNFYDKNSILKHIDNFFNQHISRYQLKNNTSQFIRKRNKDFFIELLNKFSDKNYIILSALYLDDLVIAYHLGFDYSNKIIWYKPAFNIGYKEYSPGTILLKHLIEYSVSTSKEELDFTIGDEAFKSRFSNKTRENQNIAFYRSKLKCRFSKILQFISIVINRLKIKFRKS